MKLNLGCGKNKKEGYINVDRLPEVSPDMTADLNEPLPWKNNSIDEIYCWNTMEHLENPVQFISECHRILKPGCKMIFRVPLAGTFTFYNELTHKINFTPKSFNVRYCYGQEWNFKKKLWVTLPLLHIKLPCFFYYFNSIINNFVTGLEGELIKG